jgi:hypothetical protein
MTKIIVMNERYSLSLIYCFYSIYDSDFIVYLRLPSEKCEAQTLKAV